MSSKSWYEAKNEPHVYVYPYIKKLDNLQSITQEENIKHMRLYGDREYEGIKTFSVTSRGPYYAGQHRITLNIVQSMIDTAVAKITKNRPLPYFLTSDGDFSQTRRAEKLTQFIEGQFHAANVFEIMPKVFKDACIFGTGIVKVLREGKKIICERVFPDEIKVDNNESIYGKPRQMHQLKWIHKDVLISMFPNKRGSIEGVISDTTYGIDKTTVNGDMVLVTESWKLPDGDKENGFHCITIINDTLFKETYTKNYFPFVILRWNEKPLGFWGQGIAEQLAGLQLEINKLLKVIQVSMHLVSVPKIFIEASSKIVTQELNNQIGSIIRYAGAKPEQGSLGSIPPELFSQLDRLYQRAFEIVGISQLSAGSQKPAGLNSGKALRTYNDLETERFSLVAKQYEKSHLDLAEIMVDFAKDIGKETRNYEIKVPGSKFLKTISWKDVNMDDDQYIMQIFPVSAFSQDPSSRFQEIQELIQAGFIPKEAAMKLLNFPDLKGFYSLEQASIENLEMQIEKMIDKGEYESPEPFQNLAYGIKLMQQAYLKYKNDNAPDDRLELLRQWMSDAQELLLSATAQQQAAMAPPASADMSSAQGQPSLPPTSDLIPR